MGLQTADLWSETFKKLHVDPSIFKGGQDFVSAESIALCARLWTTGDGTIENPDLRFSGGPDEDKAPTDPGNLDDFVAIGLVQNVSISQNKAIQQLFEIGSKLPYFIPGRTIIQVNVGRIVLNGDSLLKMFYPTLGESGETDSDIEAQAMINYDTDTPPGANMARGDNDSRQFFINLASGFFNLPMDLLFYIMDSEKEPVGGVMLRQCYVQSHQMGVSAQQTVVAENVSIRCAQLIPLGAG